MPLSISSAASKAELRKQCKAFRQGLSYMEKYLCENAIVKWVLALPDYQQAQLVLLYLSTEEEIDTRVLVAHALLSGKKVAVPRCRPGSRIIDFCFFDDYRQLVSGFYGIAEPPPDAAILSQADLVGSFCIVPALAAAVNGQRLGYGGGYYDRFLADFCGTTAVLTYDECVFPQLPTEATDIAVKYIITPSGIKKAIKAKL
ncbi:MAG: 5-formyltetrahydrofolate cyclo-ligase [Angelakisella sp.]|nr:5-formyltetrahydrofolate cyclo-ligase [Angelakisella sp.]